MQAPSPLTHIYLDRPSAPRGTLRRSRRCRDPILGKSCACETNSPNEKLDIQRKVAGVWIALGEKNLDAAIESMREADDREDHTEKHVSRRIDCHRCANCWMSLLFEAKRPAEAALEFESECPLSGDL